MIDKKTRRAELEASLAKAEDLVRTTQQQILVLRGGITMLNELITDEEQETQNVQTTE
jgi:hypothetical protein